MKKNNTSSPLIFYVLSILIIMVIFRGSCRAQVPVPGRVQAEDFTLMSGVLTASTSDIGGGLYVGWIDPGDWMEYNVSIKYAGTYLLSYRIATPATGETIFVKDSTGNILRTLQIPNTGGWNTWKTATDSLFLPAGKQKLRFYSNGQHGWNVNWWQFDFVKQLYLQGEYLLPGTDSTIKVSVWTDGSYLLTKQKYQQ